MSKISILIVTLLVAAVWCVPTVDFEVPEGYCHYGGVLIKKGETKPAPVGECIQMTCENPKTNHKSSFTCSAFDVPEGCHSTKLDLTKPHPECCPHAVCD